MKKYVVALLAFFMMATPSFAEVVSTKNKVVAFNLVVVDEESFALQLAVPGYSKSDFNVKLKDNVITVSAEVNKDSLSYKIKNFFKKSFTQQFTLEKGVTVGKLTLSDGVLTVALSKPLPPDKKTKTLTVE